MNFHILALAALGKGISGSDRIFIEVSRKLTKKGHQVFVYVWEEGFKMCQSQNLSNVKFIIWPAGGIQTLGFFVTYLYRIINSLFRSLFLDLENNKSTIIYSASDFWMDSLPGWILKNRFPNLIWIATFYLSAPNPFVGYKEQGGKKIPSPKDSIYWLMQRLPYFLIKNKSDLVCVTSEPDVDKFPMHKAQGRYFIMKGGVEINIDQISKNKNRLKSSDKIYSAVFIGRFHQQKGVLELIDIWSKVVAKIPQVKLALIGDGPLMESLKLKVKKAGLEENVVFFGYLFDGDEKYRIFKQSKIVVHPAIYDSGGMAPAEAMAFGLPGVSFDLLALKSYYPKGMLKARLGDLDDFADKIIQLLTNSAIYIKLSNQATDMIKSEWSWEKRTDQFLKKVEEITNEKR